MAKHWKIVPQETNPKTGEVHIRKHGPVIDGKPLDPKVEFGVKSVPEALGADLIGKTRDWVKVGEFDDGVVAPEPSDWTVKPTTGVTTKASLK